MEGQTPLDQLRPNHLPDPVSFWPPAAGWWIVGLLATTLLALAGFLLIRHWYRNRYRKVAVRQARATLEHFQQHQSERQFAHDCNRLLKQVALYAFGDQEVAGLYGRPWLAFLAETGRSPEFLEDAAQALGENRFNPGCTLDVSGLHQLTLRWIKKHHA